MAVDAAGIDLFECILKAWPLSKSSFCWNPGDETYVPIPQWLSNGNPH